MSRMNSHRWVPLGAGRAEQAVELGRSCRSLHFGPPYPPRQGAWPADTGLRPTSPHGAKRGEGAHAPRLEGPRTVLALPALQAVSALLAEFSGPSPFPLAVFAVPFLAPCKAICAHRRGDALRCAEPAGLQLPPPWAQRHSPPEQKHRGELVGAGGETGGCDLFPGTVPLRAPSPVPSSLIPPSSTPLGSMLLVPRPCCFLAPLLFPVSPPAGINTEHSFKCPGSLAAALSHHLPLPPTLTSVPAAPALPQSPHHRHAQWRETDPGRTENQPPPCFPAWGWRLRRCP